MKQSQNSTLSLLQLTSSIKDTLDNRFNTLQWVVAEINEMNINRSGHCYIELIEKDKSSNKIVAKSRATIWAFAYRMIKPYFETTTGEAFRAGIKVLLKVSVEFHQLYGFSLNVQDIDPQYTLGDLARKKAETLKRLKDEGVFEMNKMLSFPIVPQRIAVISSETAAGYGDFINQLKSNSAGYYFYYELFNSVMQGDKSVESINNSLFSIFDRLEEFDVVVIIRGGGEKSELSIFDDYDLAFSITQLPLPVITGIGHERDDSVVDSVAYKKLKTPTAVAEYLIETVQLFDDQLSTYNSDVITYMVDFLDLKNSELSYYWEKLNKMLRDKMENQQLFLAKANQRVIGGVNRIYLHRETKLIENSNKLKYLTEIF